MISKNIFTVIATGPLPRCIRVVFLIFILMPPMAFCQLVPKEEDLHKMEIDKDIFRIMMTATMDPGLAFTACYEHEIAKPFTLVLKAGPTLYWDDEWADVWGNAQYRWSVNAGISGELRYYYNLKRRTRLEKTTRNFSAGYLSLEPFIITKSVILGSNKSSDDTKSAGAGVYINTGYQKQFRKGYIGVFFGTRFGGKIYSTSSDVFDIIHGGITVGRVLY